MPLTVEDIPGLFLRKAKGLQELLVANEHAELKALVDSERGELDIIAAANVAPDRLSAGMDKFGPPPKNSYCLWPQWPGTEHAFRAANIQRHTIAAIARALAAGAYDAVSWALGAFRFSHTKDRTTGIIRMCNRRYHRGYLDEVQTYIPLAQVLEHDGLQLAIKLPCAAYIELARRGFLDENFMDFFIDIFLRKFDLQTESTDVLVDAIIECGVDPQDFIYRVYDADLSPGLDVWVALYCRLHPASSGEEVVREALKLLLPDIWWPVEWRDWAMPFVDEYEYWQIVREVVCAMTCDGVHSSCMVELKNTAREKLRIPPKNAVDG